VFWEEAVQKKKDGTTTQFWTKQPRFQLRKVAIAQAFRLAFPDELGGLPYESSELPDNENSSDYIQSTKSDIEPNVKTPTDDYSAILAKEALRNESQNTFTSKKDSDVEEEDFLSGTIRRIEDLFETYPSDFTKKHQEWILDKVYKATDKAGIEKMLAYTEKVTRKAA
jgi:hypothetical protein